jgi:hypothetical protein
MPQAIQVQGLAEFRRALRQVDGEAAKALRLVHNRAADAVVQWAAPRVPQRSGKASRSIRATSPQLTSKVTGGGARVPYYGWADFGGRVGRKRSVHRAFLPGGRYIYPGYEHERDRVQDELEQGVREIARSLGWDVTG